MLRWIGQFWGRNKAGKPRVASTALLLAAFVLVAHSFEVCGSHLGLQKEPVSSHSASVTHNGVQCAAPVGVACLCADCVCVPFPLDSDFHEKDGCEFTSELATRAQLVNFQLDAPLIDVPVVASLPAANVAPATLIAFLGSDGPPLARLCSQFLTSPRSGRAPPISA